ncbi:MAG: DUF6152 family protein [Steroidobacteraceae bacterium]
MNTHRPAPPRARVSTGRTLRLTPGWLTTAGFAVVVALFSTPAYVHHSGAMFDGSKDVKISGTVMEFHWTNPHSSFKLSVPDGHGSQSIWSVEMGGPNNLIHEGWKRTTLKPGDKVTATVHPLKDGTPGGQYVAITLANGRTLTSNPDDYKPTRGY